LNQPRIHIGWYALGDGVAAIVTWVLFYFLRHQYLHTNFSITYKFYIGLFGYPFGWFALFLLLGNYTNIYNKSRLVEFFYTAGAVMVGGIIIFFLFLLPPSTNNVVVGYNLLLLLAAIQFFFTYLSRIFFLAAAKKQLQQAKVFFNTLIVGLPSNANTVYKNINNNKEKTGFRINGFINIDEENKIISESEIKNFGLLNNLNHTIESENIEEVIIAVEKNDRKTLEKILQQLSSKNVGIKIMPDTVDIMTGALKTYNVLGVPLIDVHAGLLPAWQQNIKRLIDIIISASGLIILFPLFVYIAIRVSISSKGKMIYLQQRVGYKGKIFTMYKFRSMETDAEINGPQLSSDFDNRINKWGKTMRKWRLDELPQLVNILQGPSGNFISIN
jgi:polysaccharide biosynthesis protein PslA